MRVRESAFWLPLVRVMRLGSLCGDGSNFDDFFGLFEFLQVFLALFSNTRWASDIGHWLRGFDFNPSVASIYSVTKDALNCHN
jgi:hypothetical protein